MPSQKIALFVFNGDPMCFIHVLLNAMDFKAKGDTPAIVIEGAATKLLPALAQKDHPLHPLWEKAKNSGWIDGVCEACSRKMETLDSAKAQGLALLNDMNGHPGMAGYKQRGYEILTF